MNKKLIIFLLPIFIIACKKQAPVIVPEPKALASTRSTNTNGHNIVVTYNYNNAGILYQEITKDETNGAELFQNYTHMNGILHRSTISSDQRQLSMISYEYTADKLIKMRYYEYDQYLRLELLFDRNFEYKNGRLYKISTITNNGQLGDYSLFTFTGENVTEIKNYEGNGTLLNTAQYEYDDKLNPYFNQYGQLFNNLAYSKSNITKATYTDYSVNKVTTIQYNYTYNSSGQPTALYSGGKLLVAFNY